AKTSFLPGYQFDLCTEAADNIHPLSTEPVGHNDRHRVAQCPANGSQGNSGIATSCLDNPIARSDLSAGVRALEDMKGHTVFHTARQVIVFTFHIDTIRPALVSVVQPEHRRVTHEVPKLADDVFDSSHCVHFFTNLYNT